MDKPREYRGRPQAGPHGAFMPSRGEPFERQRNIDAPSKAAPSAESNTPEHRVSALVRRGPDARQWPGCHLGTDDPVGDWPGPAPL